MDPNLNNGKRRNLPKHIVDINNAGGAATSGSSLPASPLTPVNHRFRNESPSPFIQSIPASNILSECVVFCDVWSRNGTDNASSLYARILDRMGAIVTKKFTKHDQITHLVFKSGHKSYVEKAQKRGIKIVSCVWVERCRVTQTRVEEKDYLVDVTNYKPPKKFCEKQPLYPEEEKERWEKAEKRRLKRIERLEAKKVQFVSPLVLHGSETHGRHQENRILAPDTPYIYESPFQFVRPNFVAETPDDNIKKKIQRMKEGKPIFSPPSSPCSSISSIPSFSNIQDKTSKDVVNPDITTESPTRCLSFTDDERALLSEKSDTSTQISTQKSDMELTCANIKGSQKSDMELTCVNIKGNLSANKIPDSSSSTNFDEESLINLHLSACSSSATNISTSSRIQHQSSSFALHLDESDKRESSSSVQLHPVVNDKRSSSSSTRSHLDATTSLCLRLEESDAQGSTRSSLNLHLDSSSEKRESLEVIGDSQEPLVAKKQEEQTKGSKGKPKAKRRFLCDEDVLKPASILMSPQQIQTPRRSNRRSSLLASYAISSAVRVRRRKSVIRRIDMETPESDTSCSVLPPVGETAVKAFAARERYFSPPIEETSSGEETDTTKRPECRKSMSTSYDDKENATRDKRQPKKTRRSVRNMTRDGKTPTTSSSSEERRSSTQHPPSPPNPPPPTSVKTQQPLANLTNAIKTRRSTDEFKTIMLPKTRRRKSVIVLTSLHREERNQIEKIIKKLGRFRVHQSVSDERVSHVICGAARRTVNVLRAISRGLWLLSKQWIFNSEQAGHWIDEVDYEAVEFFPVARETRLQRHYALHTALPWSCSLFAPLDGRIYVSNEARPPAEELRELLALCGGHVTNSPRRALVRVGPLSTSQIMASVKETWILDSISENSLKPTEAYLIT